MGLTTVSLTTATRLTDASPSLLAEADALLDGPGDVRDGGDADADVERWVSASAMAVVMVAGLSVLLF
jgi:hypothetical protein